MAIDLASADTTLAASSSVLLSETGPLRRLPLGPELERPPSFYERFDDWAVFYDVFRDHTGRHVYLIGPMALNLAPYIDQLVVEGVQTGTVVRPKIHHGVQVSILRATLPEADTHLRLAIGDQRFELAIQPNRSQNLAGGRVIFTINKNNDLQWMADWARFYVREHGATTVVVYDNGSTEYGLDEIRTTLAAVKGLKNFLVIPWPFKYGSMYDVYTKHKFGGHWPQFAQPPLFVQFFRKYGMQARSILNVDIDELVMSPFRRSIFKAVERSPFGLLRFNRVWVLNAREASGPPRHSQFVIRKKGVAARDRGKKWALAPGRAFLASWRAQPWTHQVKGWLNLSGSSASFYGYHFIGISHSWYWDRTQEIVFDPKLHVRDPLMIKTFADVFGPGGQAMSLPTIVSFWHGPMSWLEALSIASFRRHGHHVEVYSFDPVPGLPEGAVAMNAADVLPRDKLVFYKGKGTPGVFSDYFRMSLLRQGRGVYADLDVYCVRPIEGPPDYLMAYERPGSVNGAVLHIPADAPLLDDLLAIFTDTRRPLLEPHLPPFRRLEVAARRLMGEKIAPEDMQYGATGPFALTHYVRRRGLQHLVRPSSVLYPIPYEGIPALMLAGSSIAPAIKPDTLAVHIWRSQLTRRGRADMPLPEPGSALAELCAREGIVLG